MLRWSLALVLGAFSVALASEPCRPIEGIQPLLNPGRVLLLGELHGTVESPAFALDVACHAARAGLPAIVGLELATGEQARVDAFLDSPGSEEDRAALLAGPPWRSSYQDGRASHAMFNLIDGVRRLRLEQLPVRVVMFDAPTAGGGQQRDRNMARNLAEVVAGEPRAMTIVLTGNRHSRTTKGSARDSSYEPMGNLLGQTISFDRLTALNVGHGGGSAWICAPDCGVAELAGHHGASEWAIEIDDATRPAGHQGWYHVGAITASPPARMSASEVAIPHATSARAATEPDESESPSASPAPDADRPLSGTEGKLQGSWQAYDFSSDTKSWTMQFDGRSFRARGGTDEWYEGRILIRDDEKPAQIDFAIDDCRCSFKGMTSKAIFQWDGESLVIAAPRPGKSRPPRFNETSGQMLRLLRLDGRSR